MHLSVPRPIRIVLVLATIASLLAIPSVASAAPKGSKLTVVVTALTPQVSPNMDGAFEVVVTNGGKATLTHAVLMVDANAAIKSAPASCNASACDLGTLVSNDTRTLVFVVGSPSNGSVTLHADLRVDAGSGNPSQDATSGSNSLNVNTSPTFFGAWHGKGNALTGGIDDGHQSAFVSVPAVNFDYPASLSTADKRVCGEKGIGQAVDMHFANGESLLPNLLKVTVTYDAAARGNRSPGNIGFIHQADDGSCTTLVKGCASAGCFNAFWEGNGPNKKLVVVALLASNGLGKGL